MDPSILFSHVPSVDQHENNFYKLKNNVQEGKYFTGYFHISYRLRHLGHYNQSIDTSVVKAESVVQTLWWNIQIYECNKLPITLRFHCRQVTISLKLVELFRTIATIRDIFKMILLNKDQFRRCLISFQKISAILYVNCIDFCC